ncbi:DUF6093 family protein [Actinoplanes sp. NPDC051851]|uniref:DUF6093 family protein n=1 Tax=Actinoplanes sp. NPDC051851 TaxID=3154753 RepID=UPI00342297C0
MPIDRLVARAQAAAERQMRDTCTIRRRTGMSPADPVTGKTTPTYQQLYTGRCRVQQSDVQADGRNVGEARIMLVRRTVQLPMSVTGLRPKDEIRIDSSADEDLTGRAFVIQDLAGKTDASARRVGVIEATS